MTPLGKIIRQEINETGPMSVSRYMALCLGHPELGYYTTKNPIGAAGDFTTAPEISQMFGEMLGIWLLQTWADQGAPNPFALAELGPGRGTLMADILRVTGKNTKFTNAMRLFLVETSPVLRKKQIKTLKSQNVTHLNNLAEMPDLPLFLVANEFFDALPIQQFIFSDAGWQERLIANTAGGFEFMLSSPKKNTDLDKAFPNLPNGVMVETSALSLQIAAEIGRRLLSDGGAALLIDYGALTGVGDTFQAVKNHSSTAPLTNQGQCDLTAHVQFQPLCDAAKTEMQFTTQGRFLESSGLTERANMLAKTASEQELQTLIASHRRLVHPEEMGNLFKVMALRAQKTPPTIGFEHAT